MQVTKITAPPEAPTPAVRQLTEKQFYDEINYHRAEKMTKKMLDAGLITSEEHDRILAEARKIFVPFQLSCYVSALERTSDCERR